MISLLLLIPAIVAYSISQLQQHNKLRWMKRTNSKGFWGIDSWTRKYHKTDVFNAPDNWYYRFFKLGVRERFPLSATLLVNLTDGYHACQSIMFLCLAGSFSIALELNFFLVWGGILLCHSLSYLIFQRQ